MKKSSLKKSKKIVKKSKKLISAKFKSNPNPNPGTKSKVHLLRVTRAASMVKKAVKSNIDATLLKLSPNMQKTLDTIVRKIENTPLKIQDFQGLACRVLLHANEISQSLKQKVVKTSAKIKV